MSDESKLASRVRTWIEVDLEAVRENARTVARRSGARLLPMVKADGYGLGAVAVAQALEPLEPWGFGVATGDEGRALREAGITRRILVFQPAPSLDACLRHELTPVLDSVSLVRDWQALSGSRAFHLHVDTGMNREGIWWEEFTAAAATVGDSPGLEGACTHFHTAEHDPASVREQWGRFQTAVAALPRRPALLHAANSAAALEHPETAADLVRPGIFLYGGAVGEHRPRPVVRWQARVVRWRWVAPGETVGYGATWSAERRALLVTLPVGYADGYRRSLSNRGEVLIGGARARVAGTVTMDYTMAALAVQDADPEELSDCPATLLGEDERGESVTLDELAAAAGTISYEILTGLGPRVERVYR